MYLEEFAQPNKPGQESAIQNCLSSGAVVLSGAGTYYVDAPVFVNKPVVWIGNGTVIKCHASVRATAFTFTHDLTLSGVTFDAEDDGLVEFLLACGANGRHVNIAQCRFQNLLTPQSSIGISVQDGGTPQGNRSVTISNCSFERLRAIGNGVEGDAAGSARAIQANCTGQLRVTNCYVDDINSTDASGNVVEDADGIQIQTFSGPRMLNAVVENCAFRDVGKRAVKVESNVSCHVRNCYCESSWDDGTGLGMLCFVGVIDGDGTTVIENCRLEGPAQSFVRTNSTAATRVRNCTFAPTSYQALIDAGGGPGNTYFVVASAGGDVTVENSKSSNTRFAVQAFSGWAAVTILRDCEISFFTNGPACWEDQEYYVERCRLELDESSTDANVPVSRLLNVQDGAKRVSVVDCYGAGTRDGIEVEPQSVDGLTVFVERNEFRVDTPVNNSSNYTHVYETDNYWQIGLFVQP